MAVTGDKKKKADPVMCAAFILAVISAVFVRPDAGYLDYIDWRSLGILWGLMVIIQGLKENSVFERAAAFLLQKAGNVGMLSAVLVFLCFFSSMFITNDVALLTFVPLAVFILHRAGLDRICIPVIVMQTIAANLGSMITPLGNPQNLYLYNAMDTTLVSFMSQLLPYSLLTVIILTVGIMLLPARKEKLSMGADLVTVKEFGSPRQIIIYAVLFAAALSAVLRILPWQYVVAVIFIVVLGMDIKILTRADYALLMTFIFFFIFTGNMGRIPRVHMILQEAVTGREFAAGILTSQVISNVPATLLLFDLSADHNELLKGVNIGGLGTLIASMASLISYKIYTGSYPDKKGRYIMAFTAANVIVLILMVALHTVI